MCVHVAKLHPRYRGDYFSFPQNTTLKYFLVTFFHIGGNQNWNHKPKEMIQIFAIIHKNIIKRISKTSVWEKKSVEMQNLQQKCN